MSQSADRHVLRPEHFTVAPSLLGLPLASPSRRLVALLIDLLLVAILVHLGGSVLLGLAAAYAFFSFASRPRAGAAPAERSAGRKRMWMLRLAGAFVLFLVARGAWNRASSAGMQLAGMAGASAARQAPAGARTAFDVGGGLLSLRNAKSREDARDAADRVVRGMRAAGSSDNDIRETLQGAAESGEQPWLAEVVDAALPAPRVIPAESLAVWHAAALQRGDTVAADSLRPRLASALARDSLDEMRNRVSELQKSEAELREKAEHRGLLASIFQFLDELGIGFGWTGLYFTAFTSLWKGQTPGKRLLGLRVLRLDGGPMTLWFSFERFGGYAAGLVTGLLGFAQVLWDRNRQAIHDKITETVVVRDLPPPSPSAPLDGERRAYRAPA